MGFSFACIIRANIYSHIMLRTTRTVTSRAISCIIIAWLLVAYYIPYYPSMHDRWIVVDSDVSSSIVFSWVSYRLIRPTSRFALCDTMTCDEWDTRWAVFSWGRIDSAYRQEMSFIHLSLTGYGVIEFSGLSLSDQWRSMSMVTPSWSGKVLIPGTLSTGDGVLSLTSSAYIDMRRLGMSTSLFDNPYRKVIIDRRFISQ